MRSFFAFALVALVGSAFALEDCMTVRRDALAKTAEGMLGVFVPDCEKNGDWTTLQCRASAGECHCVEADGTMFAKPSRDIGSCVCLKHAHEIAKKGRLGAQKPTCDKSGLYQKIQCFEYFCQCADIKTGERHGKTVHVDELDSLDC